MSDPDPLPQPIFTTETRIQKFVTEHKLPEKPERKSSGYYSVSHLGHCIRALYYRYVEHLPEPRDVVFETERAQVGRAWEEIIVRWFETAKLLHARQVEVREEEPLNLKGFVDMEIYDEGGVFPVEVKSVDNGNRWKSEPKSDAYLQLQTYMMLQGKGHGYLLYASTQDVGDWWMFRVETDPAAHRWIRERVATIELYRYLGSPPLRPVPDPKLWFKCQWKESRCPFFDVCWKAER